MTPEQTLAWMADGTGKLLADLAGLPDSALAAPTALPGWNRRYLLSHVAANAVALRNLVHLARTGEERRMYASNERRDAGIAAGAQLPAAGLRALVESTARDLAADLDAMPAPAWDAKVITAQGLTRPASEIPWMRVREVYVHAIDLGAGTGWTDLPAPFLPLRQGWRAGPRRGRHRLRPRLGGHWRGRPRPGQRPPGRPGRLPHRSPRPRPELGPRPPRLAVTRDT